MKNNQRLFTLGGICSLIIGIILISFFVWSFNAFWVEMTTGDADDLIENIRNTYFIIFFIYFSSVIISFFEILKNSYNNFEKNHISRAFLYSVSSAIGRQIYYVELSDKIYQETKHQDEKWYEKRNFWYGTIALILFLLAIFGMLWYGQEISGQSIF